MMNDDKLESGKAGNARTVLVLGAGFSKGFYERAPLLVDTFDVKDKLLPKYSAFAPAKALLEAELKRQATEDGSDRGRVNLERLMTRLMGGMPYDSGQGTKPILDVLLADIMRVFIERIRDAREGTNYKAELQKLAECCLQHDINFITFNYDNLLDAALEAVSQGSIHQKGAWNSIKGAWNPTRGYGFYCHPAHDLIGLKDSAVSNVTKSQVLKVHGSMNWYVRRGRATPYSVDDIVHKSSWSKFYQTQGDGMTSADTAEQMERHIEPLPFVVPPVLTKSDLVQQPLLQLLWTQAYDMLKHANQVIFVGYSLPITDIAASQLFAEACGANYPSLLRVTVVDFATDTETQKQEQVKATYRNIFHGLPDDCFRFDGTRAWADQFIRKNQAEFLSAPAPEMPETNGLPLEAGSS